jgi:hypothetical protein
MADETAVALREMTELLRQHVDRTAEFSKRAQERIAQHTSPESSLRPELAAMQEKHERMAKENREEAEKRRAEDLDFRAKLLSALDRHNELLERLAARVTP